MRHIPLLTLAVALFTGCSEPPLTFTPRILEVGYNAEVIDAIPVDLDGDGDIDLLVSLKTGLRYMRFDEGMWTDQTPGTGLASVPEAYHGSSILTVGDDLFLPPKGESDPAASSLHLKYTGIGSWDALEGPPAGTLSGPLPSQEAAADFNRDGLEDRAVLDRGQLRFFFATNAGEWWDVSNLIGADALRLPDETRSVHTDDVDGDGDIDVLVIGKRVVALLSNGGDFDFPVKAKEGTGAPPSPGPFWTRLIPMLGGFLLCYWLYRCRRAT